MAEIRLRRTGAAPLVFEGEALARVSGARIAGRDQNRYHEIAVYRTAGGKYVLQVAWVSLWVGEEHHHAVSVHDTLQALEAELSAVDPLEHLVGYPPHEQFRQKQEALEEAIVAHWRQHVSELLEELGVEERID